MYPKTVKFTKKVLPHNLMHLPKLVLLMMVILSLVACQPIRAEPATQIQATTNGNTPDEEANQALIQRFYDEAVNQKNPAVIGELFDPNIVFHDLDFGADGGNIEEVMTSMPDVETTISLWVVRDDLVTAVVTFNGTHTGGELLGVPATDKPVTFTIIDIWRVKDGKITELWHNVPNSDILEQVQPESAVKAVQ